MQAHEEQRDDDPGPLVEVQAAPEVIDDEASLGAEVQQAFPALWKHVRPTKSDEFAHQAERDFSAILDYFRIRWSYEPTSFPLSWSEDGRPTEMFNPDFYLPDYRLYIEMTTMRQSLVTRKNRKLRRLRELYPDIRIKLLYRRDYQQLLDVFLKPQAIDAGDSAGPIVFDGQTIAERIGEIAAEIAAAEPGDESDRLLIVTGSAGAERFSSELRNELESRGVDAEWDSARISKARPAYRGGHARLGKKPGANLEWRRVLIVTDVVSTGISMDFLCRWLVQKGVKEIAICALLDRPDARITPVPLRYSAFTAPNELVVGYGIPIRRRFAELNYIATLNTSLELR